MKKTILIASFFTIIMLMVPCASAFEMPLSKEDQEDLEYLIINENEDAEEKLNEIFTKLTEEGILDVDEVENLYEEYYLTSDESIVNSDPWQWIVNRLGWIYVTIEEVVELYNTGMSLYYEILSGAQAVQDFFNSIQSFRSAWQAFTANPLNFQTITNLILAAIDLLNSAIGALEFVTSGAIVELIEAFVGEVQNFIDFLQSSPWLQPITIKGNVVGFEDSVTISVKSDSATTTDYYELDYTTSDATLPWFVHQCKITATYQGKTSTKNRYAFSMGVIEENYDSDDFKSRSGHNFPILMDLINLLRLILKGDFNFIDNLITRCI